MPVASVVPPKISADFGEHPIGTGAWTLVAWQHDDYVLLARNNEYFGGAPKLDSLMIRIIPEPSTAVAEFESGNVDLLYVPEANAPRWEQTDEKKALLTSAPALRLWYVALNTTRGPLTGMCGCGRRLNHAVDVRTDPRQAPGRPRAPRGRVIPPTLEGADTTRAPYAYDPAAAKKLLAAAGYAKGFDIELWLPQDPAFARVAESIQSYLAAVGVRAKIVQRESDRGPRSLAQRTDGHVREGLVRRLSGRRKLLVSPCCTARIQRRWGNVSFYEKSGSYDPHRSRLARTEQVSNPSA